MLHGKGDFCVRIEVFNVDKHASIRCVAVEIDDSRGVSYSVFQHSVRETNCINASLINLSDNLELTIRERRNIHGFSCEETVRID